MSIWKNESLRDTLYHLDIESQIGSRRIRINYITVLDRNHIYYEQVHKCFELHYLIQGREILLVENQRIQLNEGMVYYVGRNTLHRPILDLPGNDEYSKCVVNFDLQKVSTPHRKNAPCAEEEMTALERCLNHHKFWVGNDSEGCINLLQHILEELSNGRVGYYSVIQNMMANLIVLSIRCMSQNAVADYDVPSKINTYTLHRIKEFIERNYKRNITREDAARSIFVSTRHIDRILQEYNGLSFQQLLQQFRLGIAKKMLSETNLPLEHIAEDVGFSSPSYLGKLFKEKEGITASAFRRQRFSNPVQLRPE